MYLPGHAFLNVGCGSGYFSCLASCLVENCGVSHGIDINTNAVEICYKNCQTWRESVKDKISRTSKLINPEGLQFVVGNCFNICVNEALRYDRIYVGAACPEANKDFFLDLLSDEGILILPILESKQLTIVRKKSFGYTTERLSNVHFNELIVDNEVVFPSMLKILLPKLLWAPTKERHQMFSVRFRQCTEALLLSFSRSTDPKQLKLNGYYSIIHVFYIYLIT